MSPRAGHETADLPPPAVLAAIAGLLLLIAIGALVAWGVLAGFRAKAPVVQRSPFDRAAAREPYPHLEVHAAADRIRLEAKAQARLTGYGPSGQGAGLARIPIERAMALQAAKGWPDSDAPAPGGQP
jgi:hypothetical protein